MIINNLKIQDIFFSFFNGFKFHIESFFYYKKKFKNYLSISFKVIKNDYPIYGILKNDKIIHLTNKFEAAAISRGYEKLYEIKNNMLIIKKKKFEGLKFYDFENNGDIISIFFKEDYFKLPVENRNVLDIGANIGDSSIYFIKQGAEKVIGIEIVPTNFENAKKNIEINNMSKKIEILLAGCSGKSDIIKISSEQKGMEKPKKSLSGDNVPLFTLNELAERFQLNHAILKMDCEGYEYEIILNSEKDTLKKFDYILIEYHHGNQNLIKKLEKCDFNVKTETPVYINKMHLGYLFAKRMNLWFGWSKRRDYLLMNKNKHENLGDVSGELNWINFWIL